MDNFVQQKVELWSKSDFQKCPHFDFWPVLRGENLNFGQNLTFKIDPF